MRYTGPVCRLCRREGEKLYLKGDKCYTDKCPVQRRAYAPGQHGQSRKKLSEYGLQLRMKQRLRRIYEVSDRQMENYYRAAARKRGLPVRFCCRLWKCVWTTSYSAWDRCIQAPGTAAGYARTYQCERPQGRHSIVSGQG